MTMTTRRALLARSALAAGSLTVLGGCQITQSGTVTTGTLDTAKIVEDGTALVQALEAMLAAPALVVLLGARAAAASAALARAQDSLGKLQAATGGGVTLTVDTATVQALVSSLVADTQTILGLVQTALPQLGGSVATTIGNYVAAAQVLLPFLLLAAKLSAAAAARPGGGMGEAQAVALIRAQRGS